MYGSSDDANYAEARHKRKLQKMKKEYCEQLEQLLSAVTSFQRYVNQFSDPIDDHPSVVKLKKAKASAKKLLSGK